MNNLEGGAPQRAAWEISLDIIHFFFRQSWKLLTLSAVAGTISGLAGAALVAVLGKGVGAAAGPSSFAAEFFGLALLYFAAKSSSELSLLRLTQDAIYRLRIELSRKILAAPLKRLNQLGKHGLQVMLTRDIDTFSQAFQLLPLVFCDSILLLACMGYMAWLSWPLFAVFTLILAASMYGYHAAERRPLQQLRQVRNRVEELYRNFRSLIEGVRELKLNRRRSGFFVDRVIGDSALDTRRAYIRGMTGYTLVSNVGTILFYLVIGAILFVIPRWLPQTPGNLTAITLLLLYLIRPVSEIMSSLPTLRQAIISLNKIRQLEAALDGAPAAMSETDPFAAPAATHLELRGVCHRYPGPVDDRQFLLGPIDLQVRQGEILFIIGGNGSGKTTLAMLLLGLYEPESGAMLLNGAPVMERNREHYRQYFSAVLSDFHLFEHLPESGQADLKERATHYIAALGMAHKVTVEDGKFSTTELSSGQRKRLALVSAYLEDRPIYLFDEWAADQDPVFKRVFYAELLPELKRRGKTVIVISHDDAYFGCADRIVKLADGRLQAVVPVEDSDGAAPRAPFPKEVLHAYG